MRLRDVLIAALVMAMLAGCSRLTFIKPDVSRGDNERVASVRDSKPAVNKARAAETNVALGQKYMQDGNYEVAMDKLKHAIELDPKSVDANTVLGALNERIGRAQIAGKFYRRATELAPDDGAVLNNYGTWLCGNGEPAQADAWFQKALADPFYKRPTTALANAGACARRAGAPDKAEDYYRRALQIQPDNAQVLMGLALLQYDNGDYLSARGFIQRREGAAPVNPGTLDLAARIEEQLGDHEAAMRYRARLNTEFPDYQPTTALQDDSTP